MFWFLYLCNLMVWKFDTLKLRWLDPTEFLVWNYLSSTSLGCKYIGIKKQSLWQRLEFHYNIWTKPNLATSSTGHPGVPWRPCTLKIWKILVVNKKQLKSYHLLSESEHEKFWEYGFTHFAMTSKSALSYKYGFTPFSYARCQSLLLWTSTGSHPLRMIYVKIYYSQRVWVHTLCEWWMSKSTTVNGYGLTPCANGRYQSLIQSTRMGFTPFSNSGCQRLP